ncbi:MAG: hypothetical protein WD230_08200, partial [Cucumibacter sp.]
MARRAPRSRPPAENGALAPSPPPFGHKHLLGIGQLNPAEITNLIDRAERMIEVSRRPDKRLDTHLGRTQINLFFEPSTRT